MKITLDFLNNYPELMLRIIIKELKDSILIEEIEARLKCQVVVDEF